MPLSPPLLSLWPSSPTMHYLSPWSFEGYPCSCGELCLWLGVANCASFDATGLVAVKAQQPWLCHSLTACNEAPGPGLSSAAHAASSLLTCFASIHQECPFPPAACCAEEGRSSSVTSFSASTGSPCHIELVCFLYMAAGQSLSPCCFCSVYHFKRHGPFD